VLRGLKKKKKEDKISSEEKLSSVPSSKLYSDKEQSNKSRPS